MDNLQIIWQKQLAVDSFRKLQFMKVEFCEKLINIFQSNMLTRFQSLKTLTVTNCDSLQEVFELQGLDFKETHVGTAIPLKGLFLISLPTMSMYGIKTPEYFSAFKILK